MMNKNKKYLFSVLGGIIFYIFSLINYKITMNHDTLNYNMFIIPIPMGIIIGFYIGKMIDDLETIIELKTRELRKLSHTDSLTKINNRRKFEEEYEKEWKTAIRSKESMSIIMCDIDYFKQYNDKYGHQKGDETLIKVAQIINNSVKRTRDLVARYGGEEFIIMLPRTDLKGAKKISEEIRKNIENENILHEKSKFNKVTFSLGISTTLPKVEISRKKLIKTADIALYKAKENGRNISEFIELKL